MKETLKSKKGITLIALVITIIVLIILAGISISMLMGEDGLITKAKQGTQNYQNAAIEEQEMLNNLYGDFASEIAKTGSGDAVASLISFKRTIAGAITDAGVATSEDDDAETMADNIAEIYQGRYEAGLTAGQDTGLEESETGTTNVLASDKSFSITTTKKAKLLILYWNYTSGTSQGGLAVAVNEDDYNLAVQSRSNADPSINSMNVTFEDNSISGTMPSSFAFNYNKTVNYKIYY